MRNPTVSVIVLRSLSLVVASCLLVGQSSAELGQPATDSLAEARALQARGKYKKSRYLLDDVLANDHDSRIALGLRSIALANTRQPLDALDDFQRFLELEPSMEELREILLAIADAFGVRRDGDFSAATAIDPIRVYTPEPDFALSIMRAGRGVRFTLLVLVQTNGRVGEIEVTGIKPPNGADQRVLDAVLDYVRQYRFIPGIRDGKPIKMHQWIEFGLEMSEYLPGVGSPTPSR